MAVETNLREAEQSVKATGVVSEKNLELAQVDGKETIRGTVSIQTSDINTITFRIYVNKMTKAGTINKAYAGMQTVMDSYQSVADVGLDSATRVVVSNGKLNPNTYFDASGKHESLQYQTNFFNRMKDAEDFKAEWDAEVFIYSLVRELHRGGENAGEETGRLVVNAYMPTYSGIAPLTLIATEDIADAVESAFTPGQTAKFFGEIVSSVKIERKEIQVVIGKPRSEEKRTFVNELIITGASEPYDEDSAKAFKADVIKAALVEREAKLAEDEAKSKSKNATPSASAKPIGQPAGGAGAKARLGW